MAHRMLSILVAAGCTLLLTATGSSGIQGGPHALPAGFMEKHIQQMKEQRPLQYQRMLAAAIQPITECASCHVETRKDLGSAGEAPRPPMK